MFTIRELCDRWKVSVDTIRRLMANGELPYLKIGHHVRFRREDVEAFELNNLITSFPTVRSRVSVII